MNINTVVTDILAKHGVIDEKEKYIYETGIELIISDIINIFLILIACVVTNTILYSIIYLTVFPLIRVFSGGYHAKTYMKCRSMTVGIYLLIILVNNIMQKYIFIFSVLSSIISMITVICFAPVKHPNRQINRTETAANKFFAVLITFLLSILSVFLTLFNIREGVIISLTMLSVAFLIPIGIVANKRRR